MGQDDLSVNGTLSFYLRALYLIILLSLALPVFLYE